MSGSWASGWVSGDIVTAAEFKKGTGAVFDLTVTGSVAANVDITGIPAGYAALRLALFARGDTAAAATGINMRFNNDSGANYGSELITANASTVTAGETVSATSANAAAMAAASATAGHASAFEILIPNYAGTTFFKNWSGFGGFSQAITTTNIISRTYSGVWISTAAINRITLIPAAGNFAIGTRVTLYAMGA